jgi:uncharacterized membrane protein
LVEPCEPTAYTHGDINTVRQKKGASIEVKEPHHTKEPMASREFNIGAILVTTLAVFAFWGYSPASALLFAIAILASVLLVVGFWTKKRWARGAAMLIAVLSVASDLIEFGDQDLTARVILAARIVVAVAVLYWSSRAGVRVHFIKGACDKA